MTADPGPATGKRARARLEQSARIMDAARRHLREHGADGLSLRAIARELGLVSSAVYRYFGSRDELLTALIIEAYESLGRAGADAGRAAREGGGGPRAEFVAVCAAIRDWARHHPHRWALLYGSPVPGYRAPQETIAPAGTVLQPLIAPVVTAAAAGELLTAATRLPAGGELARQAAGVRVALGFPDEVPAATVVALATGWAVVIGTVSAELFGQFTNAFDPADELASLVWDELADRVGLPGAGGVSG